MSGNVGVYYLDGQFVDVQDVRSMSAAMKACVTDKEGVWCQDSVGLGHRMLWTTPESIHEELPFPGRSGDVVITADARIDNRIE